MATAVRELRPTRTAPPAPTRTPVPAVSPTPIPETSSERVAPGSQPRRSAGTPTRDPYDEPVNPWLIILYLVAVFLVLDVGMIWAGARLVAGTGT